MGSRFLATLLALTLFVVFQGCYSGLPETLEILPDTDFKSQFDFAGTNKIYFSQSSDDPYFNGTFVTETTGYLGHSRFFLRNKSPMKPDYVVLVLTLEDPKKALFPFLQKFSEVLYVGNNFILDPPPMITETKAMYEEVRYPGKIAYGLLSPPQGGSETTFEAIIWGLDGLKFHLEALAFYPDGSYGVTSPEVEASLVLKALDPAQSAKPSAKDLRKLKNYLGSSKSVVSWKDGVEKSASGFLRLLNKPLVRANSSFAL